MLLFAVNNAQRASERRFAGREEKTVGRRARCKPPLPPSPCKMLNGGQARQDWAQGGLVSWGGVRGGRGAHGQGPGPGPVQFTNRLKRQQNIPLRFTLHIPRQHAGLHELYRRPPCPYPAVKVRCKANSCRGKCLWVPRPSHLLFAGVGPVGRWRGGSLPGWRLRRSACPRVRTAPTPLAPAAMLKTVGGGRWQRRLELSPASWRWREVLGLLSLWGGGGGGAPPRCPVPHYVALPLVLVIESGTRLGWLQPAAPPPPHPRRCRAAVPSQPCLSPVVCLPPLTHSAFNPSQPPPTPPLPPHRILFACTPHRADRLLLLPPTPPHAPCRRPAHPVPRHSPRRADLLQPGPLPRLLLRPAGAGGQPRPPALQAALPRRLALDRPRDDPPVSVVSPPLRCCLPPLDCIVSPLWGAHRAVGETVQVWEVGARGGRSRHLPCPSPLAAPAP